MPGMVIHGFQLYGQTILISREVTTHERLNIDLAIEPATLPMSQVDGSLWPACQTY